MTTNNNNNAWVNQLPGVGPVVIAPQWSSTPQWSMTTNAETEALTINNGSDSVLTFRKNGEIESRRGKITVDEWIVIINLMKQFIIDVSSDEETANKYPYLKDAAHQWMIDKLTE